MKNKEVRIFEETGKCYELTVKWSEHFNNTVNINRYVKPLVPGNFLVLIDGEVHFPYFDSKEVFSKIMYRDYGRMEI